MATKIRLGELAGAITATPKTLHNWFARYDHIKPKAKQEGTWLEFSWGDVAAFAITVYLIDLGMGVAAAFTHAQAIVEQRWPDLYLDEPSHLSLTAKNSRVDFDVGPGLRVGDADKWWTMADIGEPEEIADRVSKGLKDKTFPLRATVTIYIGFIIIDAFEALRSMGHNPPPLTKGER
jgi:hypothetical protein